MPACPTSPRHASPMPHPYSHPRPPAVRAHRAWLGPCRSQPHSTYTRPHARTPVARTHPASCWRAHSHPASQCTRSQPSHSDKQAHTPASSPPAHSQPVRPSATALAHTLAASLAHACLRAPASAPICACRTTVRQAPTRPYALTQPLQHSTDECPPPHNTIHITLSTSQGRIISRALTAPAQPTYSTALASSHISANPTPQCPPTRLR